MTSNKNADNFWHRFREQLEQFEQFILFKFLQFLQFILLCHMVWSFFPQVLALKKPLEMELLMTVEECQPMWKWYTFRNRQKFRVGYWKPASFYQHKGYLIYILIWMAKRCGFYKPRKWFHHPTLQAKWVTSCETAWKSVPKNGVIGVCMHFCLRMLVHLERCESQWCLQTSVAKLILTQINIFMSLRGQVGRELFYDNDMS